MDNFFGDKGILSEVFPGYEPRPEQVRMAEAVAGALETTEHLIVEAGTGVGKSLAYLVPLIESLLSTERHGGPGQRRAVVSTYTKALQRQLIEKELPFLRDHIFEDLRFALCLGSENYLCLRRLDQAKTHRLFETDETEDLKRISRWAKKTATGIRSEIEVSPQAWQKVCRESDLCRGRACRRFESCFYQEAKAAEKRAHILVTNHHLFFAHVASGWNVIPPFSSVVFDEAHELEDVAADYLGAEFSRHRLRHLLDAVQSPRGKGLLARLPWLTPPSYREMNTIMNMARMSGEAFFNELAEKMKDCTTLRIRERGFIKNTLSEVLIKLADALNVMKASSQDEDEEKEITALALRSEALALSLRLILEQEIENHVYWAERENRKMRLAATPLDIARILEAQVFAVVSPAILTSATLATNESFGYIKERLGLPRARTLRLTSPFDYTKQALLYIPDHISEPRSADFERDLIDHIGEILRVTMGGTMVLFTSYSLMNAVFNALRIPGLELIRQGERDNYLLVQMFRKKRHSVLFGTYTFWQGIDIPGDDLRCVVITRLPFAVPDEPVTEARMEELVKNGKNPFSHYQIPRAVILLKQGFGRLIRTKTDKGAVGILDSRIRTKGYGPQFLKSLPACKITGSIGDIKEILNTGDCTA